MTSGDISYPMQSKAASGSGAEASGVGPSGGRLSREEFVRRFKDVSRALWCIAAARTGKRDGAEDIVQQAAVVALERLDEFDPGTSFLAWMSKIVRLTALNEVHKDARRRTAPADPLAIDGSTLAPPADRHPLPISLDGALRADQESFDDEVLAALRSLDVVARSCLLLRVCLNVPYKELALALDIPAGTAMSHVDRARRAVREHILASRSRPAEASAVARPARARGATAEGAA